MEHIDTALQARQQVIAHQLEAFPGAQWIAVSKYAQDEAVLAAYHLGIRHFGENYVQDALARQERFAHCPDIQWHLIGPLQRNKVAKVVGRFYRIHSVDSVALAEKISAVAVNQGIVQAILLQVNVSREPQKNGFLPEALTDNSAQVMCALGALPGIQVCGFMGMTPTPDSLASPVNRVQAVHAAFEAMVALREKLLRETEMSLEELSMGMSDDYEIALTYGATWVRIGRQFFGGLQGEKGVSL